MDRTNKDQFINSFNIKSTRETYHRPGRLVKQGVKLLLFDDDVLARLDVRTISIAVNCACGDCFVWSRVVRLGFERMVLSFFEVAEKETACVMLARLCGMWWEEREQEDTEEEEIKWDAEEEEDVEVEKEECDAAGAAWRRLWWVVDWCEFELLLLKARAAREDEDEDEDEEKEEEDWEKARQAREVR